MTDWIPSTDEEKTRKLREDIASAVKADWNIPDQYPPPNGWLPDDFPQITIDHISYTSNPMIRPDPTILIERGGWMYIETGGHRIAIPDEAEWEKFKRMGDCTWNDYRRVLRSAAQDKENPHDDTDAD